MWWIAGGCVFVSESDARGTSPGDAQGTSPVVIVVVYGIVFVAGVGGGSGGGF